jgi:hypothetical protein
MSEAAPALLTDAPVDAMRSPGALRILAEDPASMEVPVFELVESGDLINVCLQCGRRMEPRKCKLICECGYFLSCSDFI